MPSQPARTGYTGNTARAPSQMSATPTVVLSAAVIHSHPAGFSLYGRARKALASMPGHARRYRMTRARFVAAPASSASRYESHLQPAYSAPAIVHMNVHGGSDGRRRSAPAVSTI